VSKGSGMFKEKNGQMYFLNWFSEAWLFAGQHSSLAPLSKLSLTA
jgi:hypothetical protein